MAEHHVSKIQTPQRPAQSGSLWQRWREIRTCRKTTGHCWHPQGIVDWFCCMCPADTDGMPPHNCVHCKRSA